MGYSLLESANRFMSKDSYDQAKIEETDDEEIVIGGEEEGELEGGEDLEGLEDLDAEGEEELPLMPVEAAIRAIQLVLNGEAESAEQALDMVQDMEAEEGDGEELDGELELGDEEEVEECSTRLEGEDVEEEVVEEEVVDGVDGELEETTIEDEEEVVEEEEEPENYGESHSKFLRLSQRYL